MMRLLISAAILFPTFVFAAGGGNDQPPPKPAVNCEGAQVYDTRTKKCVDPQDSSLQRDQRYQMVRQLAYAGRYHDAQALMTTMSQDDAGRLTYMGFTHRKLGNIKLANFFYEQAIAQDPANILARSYMGQGLVQEGDLQGALAQLRAIRAHGGAGTWSEVSLYNAISTGTTYSY